MKNFTTILSSKLVRSFTLLLVSVSVLAVTSCKKQEQVVTSISYFRVINASPTLGTYDAYINGQKANTAALPFGGTIRYVQPASGQCDVKFTIANDVDAVLTKSVTLTTNSAYSYYLIGKGAALEGLLITDVMANTATDKAYVKFINLSPDAPELSLNIVGGASLATSRAYKATSEFVAVDAKTQSFEIKNAAGVVQTTLLDQALQGGRYYTIIARGVLSPGVNDQRFSAQAIINQ
jgi:hypothetical protein